MSPAPTSPWPSPSPPPIEGSRSGGGGKPLACFGEVGLTGELRFVAHPERRVAEALKFGLGPIVAPPAGERVEGLSPQGTLRTALQTALIPGVGGEVREAA